MNNSSNSKEEEYLRILRLVWQMRNSQKSFFASKGRNWLESSKQLEGMVDVELSEVFAEAKQESLF